MSVLTRLWRMSRNFLFMNEEVKQFFSERERVHFRRRSLSEILSLITFKLNINIYAIADCVMLREFFVLLPHEERAALEKMPWESESILLSRNRNEWTKIIERKKANEDETCSRKNEEEKNKIACISCENMYKMCLKRILCDDVWNQLLGSG